ncbi:MAG: YfbR-like 5'-deoxynucleotidase [Candidatus Pacearchaeota archaeon]|jgi:hypothetical protein
MNFKPIILNGFEEGREQKLEKIKRYIEDITPVMFYRTNDLLHSQRVRWHLEEALNKILNIYPNFNVNFARTLAKVHDDLEILTDDITLYAKERMTSKEREELVEKEKQFVPDLTKTYSEIANNESYEKLLLASKNKDSLESQFVSFFDKFDGAGEAWHEVWAGNEFFILPAGGKDAINGGYIRRLNKFPIEYPNMQEFFKKFPEYLPQPINLIKIAMNGKPHTAKSLEKNTNYVPYERWKRNIIKNEGIDFLTTQIEFY